jgi:DNA-binding beta-propeller fold protein YncE
LTPTPTPTPPPPPPPPTGRLFISHRAGNTVGVYDATNYSLLDEVVVGAAPLGLAFDTVRDRVIVTLNDGTVVTFAADDFTDITSYPTVGTLAADVAYDPINDAIFVPHRFGGQLAANNAGTFASLAGFPVALTELVEVRVDAAGQRAFSIQNNGSSLFVVDIAGATSQTIVVPGGGFLDGLAYDDSPQRLFVGGFGNGSVIVYDASLPLPTQIQTIGTGNNPTSVAVDNVNDRVYTANATSFDVAVFDYDQGAVVNPLTFDQGLATDPNGVQGPIGVYFDAQRNRILTTNETADTISVFDATTLAPVGARDFPAGDGPYVILVEP